jgi:hypothetical protein
MDFAAADEMDRNEKTAVPKLPNLITLKLMFFFII